MPIRPENVNRYPDDWADIRRRILARAGNRCEGSPPYPDCRAANHERHPVTGSIVVLTIAHLDHEPENCDAANLRAWCQRCHNTYDAPHRARTRRRSLTQRQIDLLEGHPEEVQGLGQLGTSTTGQQPSTDRKEVPPGRGRRNRPGNLDSG